MIENMDRHLALLYNINTPTDGSIATRSLSVTPHSIMTGYPCNPVRGESVVCSRRIVRRYDGGNWTRYIISLVL